MRGLWLRGRARSVLPVFRRGPGRLAIDADFAEQLGRATSEAGIRNNSEDGPIPAAPDES